MPKKYTIEITGKCESDIESTIEEVTRLIQEGYLSGGNENNTASFSFDSSGDFDPMECRCESCGMFGSKEEFLGKRKKLLRCPDCESESIHDMTAESVEAAS